MQTPARGARRAAATLIAAAVALTAAGCSDDSGGDRTRSLALASTSGAAVAAAAESRADGSGPATGEVTSTITLPAGPSSGSVFRPSIAGVTTERVSALAQSLGLAGRAEELAGGWVAPAGADTSSGGTATAPRLIVVKDDVGSWFYGTSTSCDLTVAASAASCATSSDAVAVAPPSDNPDASQSSPTPTSCSLTDEQVQAAQAQAEAVIAAVGASGGTPATDSARCSVTVTASATIDGQRVDGLTTSVTSDASSTDPVVSDANGTLATWSQDGEPLPLVDAADALDRLNALPQPAIAELCRPATKGDGCLTTARSVVAADPGLMRDTDLATGGSIVVPAWTFSVRTTLLEPDGTPAPAGLQPTGTSTVSVTSLDDSVLGTAPPVSNEVPPPDDGAGGGTSPGSTGGADADVPEVPPADPGVDGAEPLPATGVPLPVDVPEQRGTANPSFTTP